MGFKPIMERKIKKPGIPLFGSGIDDGSHIVIEDGLRYAIDLVKEPDVSINNLKKCLTMVKIGKPIQRVVEHHGGHGILAPAGTDLEIRFAKVKFCAAPGIRFLSDVDITMAILAFPGSDLSLDGAITDGIAFCDEMIPDFLSVPSLFLREVSILLQDRVDLFSDLGGEGSAGTLNLTVLGKNCLFDAVLDILNPLEILGYGIPGDLEFPGDSSLGSMEIIEFYNALDIAHRFHLLGPSRSKNGAGGGIGWINLW
jgi:hypothetical protein